MPYVAVPAVSREARLAAARGRWDAIRAARPDLAAAVDLQQCLVGIVINLTATIEHGRLPRLSLPPKYLAAKLRSGIPALTGEPIPVPVPVLQPALTLLCDALARGGAGEAATHIRQSLDETRLDAGSLLTASLKRDQTAIRTGAAHRGLAPDLLWLVAELAIGPFAYALQQCFLAPTDSASPVRTAVDDWSHGYCPMCGSWPAVAEAAATHRVLRCSFCALAWELPTYACVYCGEAGEKFLTAAPNAERKDRRIEACASCGAYLKTVEVPRLSSFPLVAITDLETMDLDVAAMEGGYARPPLKEFSRAKG